MSTYVTLTVPYTAVYILDGEVTHVHLQTHHVHLCVHHHMVCSYIMILLLFPQSIMQAVTWSYSQSLGILLSF